MIFRGNCERSLYREALWRKIAFMKINNDVSISLVVYLSVVSSSGVRRICWRFLHLTESALMLRSN